LGGNEVTFRGVEVPLAPALAGDLPALFGTGKTEFRAEIRDLPRLLTLAGIEGPAGSVPELRLTLAGSTEEGRLEVSELLASTPDNTLEVTDVSLPLGALVAGEVGALVRSSRGRFRADLRDIPTLAALGRVAVGRPVPAHRLLLAGEVGEGRVEIAGGRLTAGSAEVFFDKARFDLSTAASDRDWTAANLEADLTVDVPDLGALLSLVGETAATGSVRGRVSLAGTAGAPRGSARLEGRNLAWRALPSGAVSLEAAADKQRFEVLALTVERGGDRVNGRGVFHLEDQRLEGVVLDLAVENLGFYAQTLAPDLDLSGGRFTAHVEAAGPLRAPTGTLSLWAGAASVAGVAVERVNLEARSEGGRVRVDAAVVRTGEGELALSGTATLPAPDGSMEMALETLRLARGGVELALRAPARIVRTTGGVSVDSLSLGGPVGNLTLSGRVAPEGEADLTVEVSDLTGSGWLETLVGHRASFRGADLRAHLTGPTAHPVLTAFGGVAELHLEGAPFPLRGALDADYGPGGVSLRRLELQGDLGTGVSVSGEIPYDPLADDPLVSGPLAVRLVADVPSLGPLVALFAPDLVLDGFLKGTAELQGTWDEPRGRVQFEGRELTLPPAWQPQPAGPFAIEGAIVLGGDRVEVETLRLQSTALQASAVGTWHGAPPLARLLRGEFGALAGDLALHGRVDIPELGWMVRDVEAVRRLGGSAHGEVSVEGPVAAPVVTAVLELTDAELLINGPIPGIRALSGRVTADHTSVRVERLGGELGGAPFRVSGQVVRDGSGEIRPDLTLQGEDLLLFRNEGVKLRADTLLRVAGALSALELSGELAITDARVVKKVDFLSLLQGGSPPKAQGGLQLFSFPDPPLQDARLDLAITSKAPFVIKNNLVSGGVRPDLRITGTGEVPVVLGKVYVDPTRMNLPAGRLVVESGIVQFLASDPDRPRLDLLATSKMIGYDITMQVEGPYDEPTVTLTSVPPLPDDELVLLVFAGIPPRTVGDEGAAQRSGMVMATYLGRTMLGQVLGEESTESGASILDRFDLVLGQGVTQKGEETIEASFRLKENLLGERDTLYLRGEKDVYDAFNLGVRIVFRFE
ncbi:MAG: translocation/assembly module TamB domain-containing protein, partial [Deferrisomatales bacterium]|nr:translocation/assembly module TamB domain-containing protein [Deferrisomatales bacterium]